MKGLLIITVLIIGSMIAFTKAVKDGRFLTYLDTHPHPVYVPQVNYYMGHTFALFKEFETAATYYIRVPEQYPQSELADLAYYRYLCARDEMGMPKEDLVALYETYFQRFPKGAYTQMVQMRITNVRNR